jgi:saccharopine dehydrogenase (NAD+, L-lysine-forming)
MKIGIIRESKTPPDKRAPLSPEQCRNLVNKYSDLEIIVQSSNIRCFKDEEYLKE